MDKALRADTRLSELSAFNAAERYTKRLFWLWVACSMITAGALAMLFRSEMQQAALAISLAIAAAFGVAAAGFVGAWSISKARSYLLEAELLDGRAKLQPGTDLIQYAEMTGNRYRRWARRAVTLDSLLSAAFFSLLAAGASGRGIGEGTDWASADNSTIIGAGVCMIAAFAVLILERHLTAVPPAELPEAPRLATLLRVPLATLLVSGVGCVLVDRGVAWGGYAGRLACVFCLMVAIELLGRAAATLFMPFPETLHSRLLTYSVLASTLRLQRPGRVSQTVHNWLGIDLSRSWALSYMRAALVPVLALLVLLGWGLTGVEALRVDQRAIYERFGRPIAVFGPGIHVHLPWPLGRLRPVDLGVMHDVPIAFDVGSGQSLARPAAEAYPDRSEDRLWDETHPTENAYLVASVAQGRQSFETLDIDLRVVYRVGLSDLAAMNATYAVTDPSRLVQAKASRLLARYFARHTLTGILGSDRAEFSRDIMGALQTALDQASTGLDIMAVVVEAIHPPPQAAAAYHAVQAADVGAYTAVSEQVGQAAKLKGDAEAQAIALHDEATALAQEMLAEAQARAVLFDADRRAYAGQPAAFVLERRLDRLTAGLAGKQVIIVDHRLQSTAGPVVDLRSLNASAVGVDAPISTPPP